MKKLLSILAASLFTTFLATVVLSIFYFRCYKPIAQQLPTKAELQRVNKNLIENQKAYARIQEQWDRYQLQQMIAEQPVETKLEKEVARLKKEVRNLKK